MSGIKVTFIKHPTIAVIILSVIAVLATGLVIYTQPWVKNDLAPIPQTADCLPAESLLPPVYFPLDAFTVSLQPEDGDYGAMLYIGLTLRLRNEMTREYLESQLPELHNQLILLLSQQTSFSPSSAEGKQALLKQIKQELNQQPPNGQSSFMTDVFFNTLIVR